ncbi:exported hypothetical protein [Paraburkholderia piptadeniae]|uniref:Uncharacterized protein n=1 Tax=Paraburkholderia piptadeniae TaxID=1701573 RepID=A0A1N7SMD0_9BURK|nr:hypothetical protein [Paraburkholderia piptadeniae]SIT48139.1 exported hypothetical protein [Paraburkholderia piptadeniae]
MIAITRREMLRAMASVVTSAVSATVWAQHGNMGPVGPPVILADAVVIDQTGKSRLLGELLREGVTAVQTIYTVAVRFALCRERCSAQFKTGCDKPGVYKVFCGRHPNMKATITVQQLD